jgi:hypothetical protein
MSSFSRGIGKPRPVTEQEKFHRGHNKVRTRMFRPVNIPCMPGSRRSSPPCRRCLFHRCHHLRFSALAVCHLACVRVGQGERFG